MTRMLRAALFALMVVLGGGLIAIVSALAREARLEAGETPTTRARRRGRIAGAGAACLVVTVVLLGNWWWTVEASRYARYVYKPLEATASVGDGRLSRSAAAAILCTVLSTSLTKTCPEVGCIVRTDRWDRPERVRSPPTPPS